MRRFTMVMGTGIVANAGAVLGVPAVLTSAVWLLATVLLLVFLATTRDWGWTPFLGAVAMALMTVGMHVPPLWCAGAALGVLTATRNWSDHLATGGQTSCVTLLPLVPPMVSAATGTAIDPRLAPVCLALFALALVRALPVLVAVLRERSDEAPLLWIPLGVMGQSVTAAQHLGIPHYGPPVLAIALGWLAYVVVRTVRERPAFSPAWWSFTFPLGTVVTGAAALGLGALAVGLYGALVAIWVVVGTAQLRAYSSTNRSRIRGGSVIIAARERSMTSSASSGSK